MKTKTVDRDPGKPESWPGVLVGLYPFFFFGPLMVWLAYSYPYPAWRMAPGSQWALAAIYMLPLVAGFAIGWLKRFPLWSYAYLCLATGYFILGSAELLDGKVDWRLYGQFVGGFFLFTGLAVLLAYLTRQDSPINDLVKDVRRDWTRLSLGLLIVPTVFFGQIEHEEDPVLTIWVIAPTLVLLFTALMAFLTPQKQRRALILVGGMVLALLVRLPSGKWFYLMFWLILSALVFAPSLIDRSARRSKTGQKV